MTRGQTLAQADAVAVELERVLLELKAKQEEQTNEEIQRGNDAR